MDEIWKPIPNHPWYEVSDQGRVRSLDREIWNGQGMRHWKGQVLKAVPNNGYRMVNLDKGKLRQVHALVLEAFVGPRPEGHLALRKGSPDDDSLPNLYWGTQKDRIRRSMEEGTWYTPARRRQIVNLINKGFGAYERRSK